MNTRVVRRTHQKDQSSISEIIIRKAAQHSLARPCAHATAVATSHLAGLPGIVARRFLQWHLLKWWAYTALRAVDFSIATSRTAGLGPSLKEAIGQARRFRAYGPSCHRFRYCRCHVSGGRLTEPPQRRLAWRRSSILAALPLALDRSFTRPVDFGNVATTSCSACRDDHRFRYCRDLSGHRLCSHARKTTIADLLPRPFLHNQNIAIAF